MVESLVIAERETGVGSIYAAGDSELSVKFKRIAPLDGIRGLAVLLVLLHHFGIGGDATYPGYAGKIFFGLADLGWTGVDLFFVLSGFLITGILLDTKQSSHYFRNFYARRTLRIFPLYYFVLFMCWFVIPWIVGLPAGQPRGQWWLWCYATSIYPMITGRWFDMSSPLGLGFWHFWSLSVEEHFYLIWPLLVLMLSRKGLLAACVALIIGCPVLRLLIVLRGHSPSDWPYYMTPCRADSLVLGGLVAVLTRSALNSQLLATFAKRGFWLGIIFLASMWLSDHLKRESPLVAVLGYSLTGFTSAAAICGVVLLPASSLAARSLSRGVLPFLGQYSYGIYVYQGLIWPVLLKGPLSVDSLHHATGHYVLSVFAHCLIGCALSTIIAFASWHLYEKHFLKLKRFFNYSKRPAKLPVRREAFCF